MADWTFVCNTSDVDFEDQYRFDHNDRTYCIYHLEDGFYATDGLCTHEDIHLVDGLIDGEEIECPMHLGVFNIIKIIFMACFPQYKWILFLLLIIVIEFVFQIILFVFDYLSIVNI